MTKPSITAHLVVKNDDQWVWYAINSILSYVDRFLITDTGSTDHTVEIIKSIHNPKINFNKIIISNPNELCAVRSQQLAKTSTDWLWMIDGDEIFTESLCEEIVKHLTPDLNGVVVRRFDCLGDIYHFQPDEHVGGYHMFGHTAHYSLRLLNTKIKGLNLKGMYPNEGFYDAKNMAILDYSIQNFYITHHRYLHTTYLQRSTLGTNLQNTLHRMKYKVEWGKPLPNHLLPEVFSKPTPSHIPKPNHRPLSYTLLAALITPLKMLKRYLRTSYLVPRTSNSL